MDEKEIGLLNQKFDETQKEKERIKAAMGFFGFFKRRAYEREYAKKIEKKECPFCESELEIKVTKTETNTHIAEYMEWKVTNGYYQCEACNRVVDSYFHTEKTFG